LGLFYKETTIMKKCTLLILLLLPSTALAHPGHDIHGFATGFTHPLGGFDHLLAMLALGIWAAMRNRGLGRVLGGFLVGMVLGGVLGTQGLVPPMLESWVLGSTLLATLLVALAVRLPIYAQTMVAVLFALVHGMAHGTELPASGAAWPYVFGFLSATALLIVTGWMAGRLLGTQFRQRWLGAGLTAAAASLFLA
jgi:urease accessory protein